MIEGVCVPIKRSYLELRECVFRFADDPLRKVDSFERREDGVSGDSESTILAVQFRSVRMAMGEEKRRQDSENQLESSRGKKSQT